MKLILKLTLTILETFDVKHRTCIFVYKNHKISIYVGVNYFRCKSNASKIQLFRDFFMVSSNFWGTKVQVENPFVFILVKPNILEKLSGLFVFFYLS